jgi:RND superfamily putative drug exporter
LTLGLAPTLPLALAAFTLRPGMHAPDTLPAAAESTRALRTLEQMGRLEAALTLRLVLELPPETPVFSEQGWAAVGRLERALAADPRVAAVRSIHNAAGGVGPTIVPRIFPEPVLRSFTSPDASAALFEIATVHGLTTAELQRLVTDLRRDAAGMADGRGPVSHARVLVGGVAAFGVDYANALTSRTALAVSLAAGLAFVVLMVALRSVLLALKAVLLNLLSGAAALGATVLVFQHGWFAGWAGLQAPLDGLVPSVPLLAFCAVFGIGMDYEVFLLQRVREERRNGQDASQAIVRGLAYSADVITRSAAIMAAVFVAFAFSDFMVVRMIGFALTVAVLLDATLIRLLLAPALLRLAWRWNWWPGERLARPTTPERESAPALARMTS